jgi:hypothetical protein
VLQNLKKIKVFTLKLKMPIWLQGNLNTTKTAIRSIRKKRNLLLSKPETNDRDLWAISIKWRNV